MPVPARLGRAASAFCERFGIAVPVVQAPMAGGWTTPALVAAVSGAGGLGMLAAARISADQLRRDIQAVRALTDRPFGVNFLIAPPEPFDGNADRVRPALDRLRAELSIPSPDRPLPTSLPSPLAEQLDLVIDTRVPIVSFALGHPAAFIDRLHRAGALVMAAATSVAEARALADADVDVIVAQGAEAGGHRSTFDVDQPEGLPLVGTMVLVPSIVDAVKRPVLASGGILDGRGLAAALALGASGVQMGTRFLVSTESGASAAYRRKIHAASDTDTVVTRQFTGRPARSLRNRFIVELDESGAPPLPWPFQSLAADDVFRAGVAAGSAEFSPVLAGQGAALVTGDLPAAEIVRAVVDEAAAILERLRNGSV